MTVRHAGLGPITFALVACSSPSTIEPAPTASIAIAQPTPSMFQGPLGAVPVPRPGGSTTPPSVPKPRPHVGARLMALGDTGEGNDAERANAESMAAICQSIGGCDAVLLNGDNFYESGVTAADDPQWVSKFEDPFDQPDLNPLPFYAIFGNHDYGPKSKGSREAQLAYGKLPVGTGAGHRKTAKWNMPSAYYSVTIRDTEIFAIDTVDFTSAKQRDDMKARVAKSTAKWKIVFGHHPRFTSGAHYADNKDLDKRGLGAFLQAVYCKADVYMCGHDHDREFIERGRDTDCPDTTFIVTGSGSKVRPTKPDVPVDPKSLYFDDSKEGFTLFESEGEKLFVRFYDKNGRLDFERVLEKK